MGSVWLAQHTMLGRRAALKVLHAELSARPDIVTRFFNEARAATAISDPGIVQVFDFGHHTDGSAYIVMELLEGEPLGKRLERLGRLPIGDALRVVRQVASSLGAAHVRGIVHRDLKPENVFLVRDPEVPGGERAKILDFGIAKLANDSAGIKTQTSAVIGTPTYMSPEQCRGAGHVDQRSDVYSLGCVLFTLIAGTPPFLAEGGGELIAMHLREPPPRLSSRAIGVPPAIDEVVARCLEKDPDRRYPSGTDLANALGALMAQHISPVTMHAVVSLPVPAALGTTLSGAAAAFSAAAPRRRTGLAVAGIGVVLGSVAAIVAVIKHESNDDHAAITAARAPAKPAPVAPAIPIAPPPPVVTRAAEPAPLPDKAELAKLHIRKVLTAFAGWAASHAGAPCPSASDLASAMGDAKAINDPWGHAVAITCTDQPADQAVGAISAGPDGIFSSDDDVASWTLGREVTKVVAGARWNSAPPKRQAVAPARSHAEPTGAGKTPHVTTPAAGSAAQDDDGIPSVR
jgi:tRNA A-37 threonylcarbamoyl transferase component Bud32